MNNRPSAKNGTKNIYALLVVGALGVVFGDIGTSPLYTLEACFFGLFSFEHSPANILGVTSAVLWTLTLVVTLKYAAVVMRADNKGEGGCLALTTLADGQETGTGRRLIFVVVGIVGASLLFSDGVITPAISVLSAVEGLSAVNSAMTPYVIPISLAVLAFLFLIQRKGTGSISIFFGPVMLLWFVTLGLLGIYGITQQPGILQALNPWYAVRFVVQNGTAAFFIFGSVFLAVTGAEMLYTDIGHFGKSPIRIAWLTVAFPMLLLNYLGQSAMLMASPPGSNSSMFYNLCPDALLIPMVILSTAATIIASQAVISGMFSLARQAIQLDYWPRVRQVHTSERTAGQVYVPFVNFMLFLGTVALVLYFKRSDNLASAYGIAVSADMIITTSLITYLAWKKWRKGRIFAVCFALLYIPIDLGFFSANIAKVATGGWVVVAISIVLYAVMSTWRKGRQVLQKNIEGQSLPTDLFIRSVKNDNPLRVPGIAVFLTGNKSGTPRSLLHNFKHNKIIHDTVIIVTIVFEEVPYVEPENRHQYENLGAGIHRLDLHYGFFESPNVPATLQSIRVPGIEFKPMQVTYFLGRESLLVTRLPSMARWRKRIFRFLSMNAVDASEYFQLPSNRVVEVGLQVEM